MISNELSSAQFWLQEGLQSSPWIWHCASPSGIVHLPIAYYFSFFEFFLVADKIYEFTDVIQGCKCNNDVFELPRGKYIR